MEENGVAGTLRYFGCPAEETLMGKVFMARERVFDGVDAIFTWHPMYANTLWAASSTALNSFKLSFHGRSAHAALSPEAGRSALDAVMLADIGINYLREHVIQDARIHCVVAHGGDAPNIVPAFAQSWYYVRAPRRSQVEEIYERVLDVARGAALMTGTSLDVELVAACHEYLPNETLQRVLLETMRKLGPPLFDGQDAALAGELQATLPEGAVDDALRAYGLSREEVGDPLCTMVLDEVGTLRKGTVQPVSTDVGDVSHLAPTAQLTACCMPLGVPLHSWQAVASCGSTIGLKTMLWVAKVLALTVLDVLRSPDVLRAAQEEFATTMGGKRYECPIPAELKPLST
jgi:aminobenzoyl-glutamate utilization protein B